MGRYAIVDALVNFNWFMLCFRHLHILNYEKAGKRHQINTQCNKTKAFRISIGRLLFFEYLCSPLIKYIITIRPCGFYLLLYLLRYLEFTMSLKRFHSIKTRSFLYFF